MISPESTFRGNSEWGEIQSNLEANQAFPPPSAHPQAVGQPLFWASPHRGSSRACTTARAVEGAGSFIPAGKVGRGNPGVLGTKASKTNRATEQRGGSTPKGSVQGGRQPHWGTSREELHSQRPSCAPKQPPSAHRGPGRGPNRCGSWCGRGRLSTETEASTSPERGLGAK